MQLDRRALKRSAVSVIRASRPRIVTGALIYLLICILFNALTTNLMSINITDMGIKNYYNYMMNDDVETALKYLNAMSPPDRNYLIAALLSFVLSIVHAGLLIFILNSVRRNSPCFGNLMDGFSIWFKVLLLELLKTVFISLWSMLFIVPGIIAVYRYSQAMFILIDDPSKSPLQCIRESKEMMRGHKAELFKLDLSFLLLFLLTLLPLVGYGFRVWSIPYIGTTKAMYYEYLLGKSVYPSQPLFEQFNT